MLGGKGIASVKRTKAGTYRVTFTNEYPDIKYGTATMSQHAGTRRVFAYVALQCTNSDTNIVMLYLDTWEDITFVW